MKKIYTLVITLAAFITQAQTNFENISLTTYFDGSDLSGTDDGSGNYTSEYMEGDLSFSTTWNNSWSYWSGGWAFSNLIDSTLEVASQTYHSFSTGVYSGDNFAIGNSGAEIIVNGVANFSTIQVCNTSYAAHSMTNGDSFGKQFTGEDWFKLTIQGFNGATLTGTVSVFLADSSNSTPTILDTWKEVDLSSLGAVTKLTFDLTSSDVGDWGMNTPDFFALDNVMFDITTNTKEISKTNLTLYPNPASSVINIPAGIERLDVYSTKGDIVLSQLNPVNSVDVSSLTTGVYLVKAINNKGISTTMLTIK